MSVIYIIRSELFIFTTLWTMKYQNLCFVYQKKSSVQIYTSMYMFFTVQSQFNNRLNDDDEKKKKEMIM